MDARLAFFEAILSAIKKCGGKALVVVTDTRRTPRRYDSPEMFVTILLFERIGTYLSSQNSTCLMIFDRPAGARSEGLLTQPGQTNQVLASGVRPGDRIGITVEPAGGTSRPTTTPLVAVPLTT